jgi:hypothetical protein
MKPDKYMESENKNLKLPSFFKPLLWSYNFFLIDPKKNKKRIIINTVNYGRWKHLQWIVKFYGRNKLKKIIEETPETEFRVPALKLVSLLLGIKKMKYASRSDYIKRQNNS